MKTFTFTAQMLRSMLFGQNGDHECPSCYPLSKASGDLAKVLVVRKEIGEIINQGDIQEEYFHVEYALSHAEIWLAFEWAESNTRAIRRKAYHDSQREEHNTRTSLAQEVAEALLDPTRDVTKRLPETFVKQIAEEIAKHYKNNEFDALLKELCVEGIVKKYKETT